MKVHLAIHAPNRYGGHNLRTLCGRSSKESRDGMNVTETRIEVTCGFCKKAMVAKALTKEQP